jgi:hypothetical protein
MALSYDLREIKSFKRLYKKGDRQGLKPTPETIIFCMMVVGISELTESNCTQFYNRVELLRFTSGDKKKYFKLSDAERMIGLKVNVTYLTPTKFLKKIKHYV